MELYSNRTAPEYEAELRERLSLDGPRGLRETAIILPKTKYAGREKKKAYTRLVRIDFVGIAATTLLDAGNDFAGFSLYRELKHLFHSSRKLNADGWALRLRILMLYPFSTSAYARIQAECSGDRSSMKEPQYQRNFNIVEQVDEEAFGRSYFVAAQAATLERLQDLVVDRRGRLRWGEYSPNSVALRFTPIHPGICCLFVNSTAFFDPYILAKETRYKNHCSPTFVPVVKVGSQDGDVFKALEDHFRYLWELDVTMHCEDATYFKAGPRPALHHVKTPSAIEYERKAAFIRRKNNRLTQDQAQTWRSCAKRVLTRFCADLSPTPAQEVLFVACSWTLNKAKRSQPNDSAQELVRNLEDDFGLGRSGGQDPLVTIHIMEAVPTEFLTEQLYTTLHESTAAIVLLTADMEVADGRKYSRPNVYHELGYLLKQLGPGKLLLVVERGVEIPSNVRDIVRVEFERGKLILAYGEIAEWLGTIAAVNTSVVTSALENHLGRVQSPAGRKSILQGQAKALRLSLKKRIARIAKTSKAAL